MRLSSLTSLLTGMGDGMMKPLQQEEKVVKAFIKNNALSEDLALDPYCLNTKMITEEWYDSAVKRLVQKGKLILAKDGRYEDGRYYVSQVEQKAQAQWRKYRWIIAPGLIVIIILLALSRLGG